MTAERWGAAALAVVGVVALIEVRRLPFGTITQPGAGFFPACLAAMLTLVAIALFLGAGPRAGDVAPGGTRAGLARAGATLAALVAYAFVLEPVGFGLATFALIVVLFRAVEPQPWRLALGGAGATVVVTHVVFRVWLGVRLPVGPWGF